MPDVAISRQCLPICNMVPGDRHGPLGLAMTRRNKEVYANHYTQNWNT